MVVDNDVVRICGNHYRKQRTWSLKLLLTLIWTEHNRDRQEKHFYIRTYCFDAAEENIYISAVFHDQ